MATTSDNPKPYHLAIAIAGAVSLGSYEAGVMYEIIRAIGLHNQKNENDITKQIKIDVITGASAGGMTAAILAQKLMFEKDCFNESKTNPLYKTWVEQADIHALLKMHQNDFPDQSILSSAFIAKIANDFLLTRNQSNSSNSTRHLAADTEIQLGLALSNLNGIDFSIPTFDGAELANPDSQFVYTRFQDSFTRVVSKDSDQPEFWEELALAARACGAFPFAFRPLRVKRDKQEFDYQNDALKNFIFPDWAFTYTDGGVFNNYPLGMAKNLVNKIDMGYRDYERRFYLYVAPECKASTVNSKIWAFMENADGTMDISSIESDKKYAPHFVNMGIALANSIYQQARFQDWIETSRYNEAVSEFDTRADALRELMMGISKEDKGALSKTADYLLQNLYGENGNDQKSQLRENDFKRLYNQFDGKKFKEELKDKEIDKYLEVVDIWIKYIQVLEKSGRLEKRDIMNIYTITASNDELAGEGISAFAGFFDPRFREFDYTVGRQKAQLFLENLKNRACFNAPSTEIEELNQLKISRVLTCLFEERNIQLSDKATVYVVNSDQEWEINDPASQWISKSLEQASDKSALEQNNIWRVKNENGNLHIYDSRYIPLIDFSLDDKPSELKDLSKATIRDVSFEIRARIRTRFYDRSDRILKQLGINAFLRRIILCFIVKPELNKILNT
jgi:predicted acylesterase/phospholipase RssA